MTLQNDNERLYWEFAKWVYLFENRNDTFERPIRASIRAPIGQFHLLLPFECRLLLRAHVPGRLDEAYFNELPLFCQLISYVLYKIDVLRCCLECFLLDESVVLC